MLAARAQHDMFFILHACKPAYAHKIGDVKPTVHSSCVCTSRVHDACVHVRNAHAKFGLRMLANCKPRTVPINAINMFIIALALQ